MSAKSRLLLICLLVVRSSIADGPDDAQATGQKVMDAVTDLESPATSAKAAEGQKLAKDMTGQGSSSGSQPAGGSDSGSGSSQPKGLVPSQNKSADGLIGTKNPDANVLDPNKRNQFQADLNKTSDQYSKMSQFMSGLGMTPIQKNTVWSATSKGINTFSDVKPRAVSGSGQSDFPPVTAIPEEVTATQYNVHSELPKLSNDQPKREWITASEPAAKNETPNVQSIATAEPVSGIQSAVKFQETQTEKIDSEIGSTLNRTPEQLTKEAGTVSVVHLEVIESQKLGEAEARAIWDELPVEQKQAVLKAIAESVNAGEAPTEENLEKVISRTLAVTTAEETTDVEPAPDKQTWSPTYPKKAANPFSVQQRERATKLIPYFVTLAKEEKAKRSSRQIASEPFSVGEGIVTHSTETGPSIELRWLTLALLFTSGFVVFRKWNRRKHLAMAAKSELPEKRLRQARRESEYPAPKSLKPKRSELRR